MFRVQLPSEPVDEFTLEWYELSMLTGGYSTRKLRATYFIYRSWPEVLDNDWLVYSDGSLVYRWHGWNIENNPYWERCFDTEQAAIREALSRLLDMENLEEAK